MFIMLKLKIYVVTEIGLQEASIKYLLNALFILICQSIDFFLLLLQAKRKKRLS